MGFEGFDKDPGMAGLDNTRIEVFNAFRVVFCSNYNGF